MRCALGALLMTALVCSSAAHADRLADGVAADAPRLAALYRALHTAPELSFMEVRTSARLVRELDGLGFTVTPRVGGTGVVALMKNGPGPVLLIRTDMDALPVKEQTSLAFASTVVGHTREGVLQPVMHACGHDVHMSAWIGVARRLSALRSEWSGTVVMIGQPAEERVGGARAMLSDGLYTRFPHPTYALALHDDASLPAGVIGYTPGFVKANVDSAEVVVRGISGHGAAPNLTKDPVLLAARIVDGLQPLISRETDPQGAAVVTVGSIHGGTASNLTPDEVRLQITLRSYGDAERKRLVDGVRRVASGEATVMGLPADRMPTVNIDAAGANATYNTPDLTRRIAGVFVRRFGTARVTEQKPKMVSEDFSEYGRADPKMQTLMFMVGATPQSVWDAAAGDITKVPGLHSSRFAPDAPLTIAAAEEAMTAAALEVLRR